MDKNRFRDLLADLYTKYNSDHLKYVDELVSRNYDSPYPAVDSIFIKYNHKSASHYDPVKATVEYKIDLLKAYESGKRPFREVDLIKDAAEQKDVVEEAEVKVKKEEVEKLTDEKVGKASEKMAGQVLEVLKKEVEVMVGKAKAELEKLMDNDVTYTVTMDDLGVEVILPNKKHLAALGIGTRLIVRTKDDKPIGLVIKDIAYDSFLGEKVDISIHLERG